MSGVYYNEWDGFCAQWLRNLIKAGHLPDGEVDERSITEVSADDLRGFDQCHFFAGIGGWPYALRLAGWPDDRPVWTGSCPCQHFSSAARGHNVAGDLWPAWHSIIAANRPREIFGEQVAHKGDWLDRLCNDMEALDYEIGAAVLPAVSVGKDHARPRIYFVGHANRDSQPSVRLNGEMARLRWNRSYAGGLEAADGLSRRMDQLRAYGNAIVPQVAAAFIEAFMDIERQA